MVYICEFEESIEFMSMVDLMEGFTKENKIYFDTNSLAAPFNKP
jgi:hypothetical protein